MNPDSPVERKHYEAWCGEYAEHKSFVGMHSEEPPGSLLWFLDRYQPVPNARVLDLGCGVGRVAIYLAMKYHSDVYAFDFVPAAIAELDRRAAANNIVIHSTVARLDVPWPYPDNFFDIAIDNTASMSTASAVGRTVCRDEMFRTLKRGGMGLVNAICADDELECSLPPGEEPTTTLWPSPTPDGEPRRIEKLYTAETLGKFFDKFVLIDQAESHKVSTVWEREWQRHSLRILIKKP